MARCTMCFQDKTGVSPPYPGISIGVCRGCYLQLDRVLGWLELAGKGAPQFVTPEVMTSSTHESDASSPEKRVEPPQTPPSEVRPTKKR